MDYRQRLFQHYVTTHFAALREISIDACERHRTTFRAYFQHLLPEDKGAKILDIGCGYGSFLYFLQKEGYRNICGVDISPEQVEAARQLGIDNVYCEDLITFLHGHPKAFVCITAFDVVEHFPKGAVLELLSELAEIVRKKPLGKKAIGKEPSRHSVSIFQKTFANSLRCCPPGSAIRWGLHHAGQKRGEPFPWDYTVR